MGAEARPADWIEYALIKIKRVYDSPAPEDGLRFLVDRLHPRGVKKDALRIEAWLKDSAPSGALRTWFGHDASHWDEFASATSPNSTRIPKRGIHCSKRRAQATLPCSSPPATSNTTTPLR